MKVLILGATGPCGQLLIQEALTRQYSVVLLVRSPHKLPDRFRSHRSVTVIEGQLTDVALVDRALAGVDAVLSALGPPVTVVSGITYPNSKPLAHAYAVVVEAMKRHGVKRLIILGTASMKDEHDRFSVIFKTFVTGVAVFAHQAYKDVVAIGELVRDQGDSLDWTIARVPVLTSSPDDTFAAGYIGDGHVKPTLSRAAFASFVLKELEVGEWLGKAPLISSP
jgi:putative NADH-flavin reductase